MRNEESQIAVNTQKSHVRAEKRQKRLRLNDAIRKANQQRIASYSSLHKINGTNRGLKNDVTRRNYSSRSSLQRWKDD